MPRQCYKFMRGQRLLFGLMLSLAALAAGAKKPKQLYNQIQLTKANNTFSAFYSHESDPNQNMFEVHLNSTDLSDDTNFYLILESQSQDLEMSIFDGNSSNELKSKVILDLLTFSGNSVLAMSNTYFNGKFDFFKESGILRFQIVNRARIGDLKYRIRAEVSKPLNIDLGSIYTTRVDSTIPELRVNMRYNGATLTELEKLRFQVTAVRQKRDYSLGATVSHDENTYVLNTVFPKTVGGILSSPNFKLCRDESCLYTITIRLSKVKTINIESFLIPKVEILSISHFEEYYDRVYSNDKVTYYNLPFEESMEEMDVTISLVPVTGTTGLYVNAKTLPLDLDSFDWKEKGPLAKRITIKWEELVQMRAERSNLYIAVYASRPGEFLLKIDAHEQGFRGRLTSGVIESGFVAYEETSNYLYYFEVFESQDITFDLKMNIVSGDADLYLKACEQSANCAIEKSDLADSNLLKVQGSQNPKTISHTFRCQRAKDQISNNCGFVIGVAGKENHGTHYEISLQETNFHHLMTPGHSVPLSLTAEQTVYLKFSYPGRAKKSSLFLSCEALWGTFDLLLSRKESYPSSSENAISESFVSTKLGLYNQLRTILIKPEALGEENLQGIYYLAVKAKTSCSLNLRFFEKSDFEISIHTLSAGHQLRAEIRDPNETLFYTIKMSLSSQQVSSASIVLTPLKGQFVMFANRNGKLPTIDNRDFYSMNNHLELSSEGVDGKPFEYVIGVKLSPQIIAPSGSYQFMISMAYSNKPLKLNPGVISQHLLTASNTFLIEVTPEAKTLLILKSVVDGYNIEMSASFAREEEATITGPAQFTAPEKEVSIYMSEADLDRYCGPSTEKGPRCFVHVKITGNMNQKVSIGFTFNDYPFQLTKSLIVTGPMLLAPSAKINFVYHAEQGHPVNIHFNSKGRDVAFYTKLVRGDAFDNHSTLLFPSSISYDEAASQRSGYITNVIYDQKKIEDFGTSPEILIAIRSLGNGADQFDTKHHFLLQVSTDAKEVLRTQTLSEHVRKDSWNYYTFYNNGNSDTLRVYVSTPISTRLEVLLTKGLQARPPFTNKPMFSKVAVGSAELSITPQDLLSDRSLEQERLRGHYTVAVKAASDCHLNIFWNNKADLNYIEITPNTPVSMALDPKLPLYFSFYAKDVTNKLSIKGLISIYIKSSVEATVYVIKSAGELNIPSSSDYVWKGSVGAAGGVTVIQIRPDHPEYCTECLYIGGIESTSDGLVSILTNVRHDGQAIPLTPGFTFPDLILSQERILYKVFNPDAGPLDFSVSMLSGFVKFYISSKPDVSETKFDEAYGLESKLEVHKFITIEPSKYKVTAAQDWYVLIANPTKESSSFTLTVDKNELMSPIEPGITKFLHLAPKEAADFIYTPKDDETLFEVRFELRQVIDETKIEEALSQLDQMLRVYHLNTRGDRFQLKPSSKTVSGNKAYLSFDISQTNRGTFALNLRNPSSSTLALSIDLLNGGYKLINFNEFNADLIRGETPLVYEGYGQKSRYLFVDLRVCHGDVNLEFFQDDRANINSKNRTDYKKITDNNAAIHYIKMEHERVFLRVTNKKEELSVYEISVFNEKDLDKNPYSELASGEKGKVEVDTESSTVRFRPVTIRQTFSKEFNHRVNYTVFLTDEFKVMRYLKGCGNHLIDQVFSSPHILSESAIFKFETLEDIRNATHKVAIRVPNMRMNTKYYGIVIARVDLFPKDPGFVSPVRSGKVFYDEFVFVSAKYRIPFNLVVAILFCFALFALLFMVVKSYVFGQIGEFAFLNKLVQLPEFEEEIFDFKMSTILEDEYYSDEPSGQTADGPHPELGENTTDLENDIKVDMEMTAAEKDKNEHN